MIMSDTNTHRITSWIMRFTILAMLVSPIACDGDADNPSSATVSPFSVSAVVHNATISEVATALAAYIHEVDDTQQGMPADWIVAGGDQLEEGAPTLEAALKLPGGSRIIEVCNHHYASQAMSFGESHGVALPCEIAINQVGDDVEVVILNPGAIFGVFFQDIPPEAIAGMGGLASAVRGELDELVSTALESLDAEVTVTRQDIGPSWSQEEMQQFGGMDKTVVIDLEIPVAYRGSDEDRQAFKALFLDELLSTLTHERMEQVGSTVAGLSVDDWRSARPYALGLPGNVSVIEMCSPTYATAAVSTGAHHAPALPCQAAVWIDGDVLRVDILDPMFIFPVFFSDAPQEMMPAMTGLAQAVRDDLQLIITSAQENLLNKQ